MHYYAVTPEGGYFPVQDLEKHTDSKFDFKKLSIRLAQELKEKNGVIKTALNLGGKTFEVSTVFLLIDHSFRFIENEDDSFKILWETMIFGDWEEEQAEYQERCCGNKRLAQAMHVEAILHIFDLYASEEEKSDLDSLKYLLGSSLEFLEEL